MRRKFSTIMMIATLFEVDAQREVLRQRDNPKNIIPFHAFDQVGDGYRFLFDTVTLGLATDKAEIAREPERYRWMTIPALMELDPEGIALRYDIPLEILLTDGEKWTPKHIVAKVKPVVLKRSA